jgi:hypothetical protein
VSQGFQIGMNVFWVDLMILHPIWYILTLNLSVKFEKLVCYGKCGMEGGGSEPE